MVNLVSVLTPQLVVETTMVVVVVVVGTEEVPEQLLDGPTVVVEVLVMFIQNSTLQLLNL